MHVWNALGPGTEPWPWRRTNINGLQRDWVSILGTLKKAKRSFFYTVRFTSQSFYEQSFQCNRDTYFWLNLLQFWTQHSLGAQFLFQGASCGEVMNLPRCLVPFLAQLPSCRVLYGQSSRSWESVAQLIFCSREGEKVYWTCKDCSDHFFPKQYRTVVYIIFLLHWVSYTV